MAAHVLEFESETHTYTLRGRVVPSVTQVLDAVNDFSMVDFDTLERARIFGTHVHETIHLYDDGRLDEDALDPALVPYLEQWKKFLELSSAVVLASEVRVWHRAGFAGTLDKILHWRKRDILADIKSGVFFKLSVGMQCAAYCEALHDCGAWPKRIRTRYCIHLTGGDRMPRARPLTDPGDWNRFLSLLNAHNMKAA